MRGSESLGSDDKFLKGREFMTASTWQTKVYKVSSLSLRDPNNL